MGEKQKSIFLRFNMEDKADAALYLKLTGEAGSAASLTAYVKRVLQEYFSLNIKIADRQEFQSQVLAAVREEMQSQGMKLVGALLAGIGTVGTTAVRGENVPEGTRLPDVCDKLPQELTGVLELIG